MPATTSIHNTEEWWINDQTPDNPYGKSEDYDAFLDHLGALNRHCCRTRLPEDSRRQSGRLSVLA